MPDPSLPVSSDVAITAILPWVGVGAFVFVACFLVVGYSMKFALAVAGVGRFGFWKSSGIVFVAGVVSTLVSLMLVMAAPGEPMMGLFAAVASVVSYCLVISMIGRCGLGKGFMTYLLNAFFNMIGMVPVVVLMMVGLAVMGSSIDPDGTTMKKFRDKMNRAQLQGQADASEANAGEFDFTQVVNRIRNSEDDASTDILPQQLAPVITEGDSSDSYFGFGKTERPSPYPTPSNSKTGGGYGKPTPKPAEAPSAVTIGPRANPFVK